MNHQQRKGMSGIMDNRPLSAVLQLQLESDPCTGSCLGYQGPSSSLLMKRRIQHSKAHVEAPHNSLDFHCGFFFASFFDFFRLSAILCCILARLCSVPRLLVSETHC